MADALIPFRFPVRSAEVWGLDDDAVDKRPEEDIAADLDFQDIAIEDYLNNVIPNVYIQQSSTASGIIDPAQLATGTPGAGKAPVGNPPVWTDIATQSELDAVVATIPAIKRGTVAWTLGVADTNTSTVVIFSSAYTTAPVVTLAVSNTAGLNLAAELTAVTSVQFTVRVFPSAGVALGSASGSVHWHAIA